MTASKVCWCIGLFMSFFLICFAIAWSFIFPNILKKQLELSPTSKSYNMWLETPLPMYLDIYLFHWKNAAEFEKNPTIKPSYEEIGPFVFREVHDRVNITWNDDGTVSYNQTRNWTLVPELSVDLETPITNINVIALSIAHTTRYFKSWIQTILNDFFKLTNSTLYVTKPAREWLFDGMDLPILEILNKPLIKKYVPFNIPDKFGFFYQRNMSATYDGRFQVFTGSDDLTQLGNLVTWNYKNQTDFFKGNCGLVHGSAGEIFPPADKPDEFTLFISDVCSPLTLKSTGLKYTGFIPHQIENQFIGDATMFDNGQNVSERVCFCEGECQPAGVRNLTLCRQGAPVFVSFPHFYLADPSYLSAVDGLAPNKSKHEFQLTIDSLSGIPKDVKASLQVNVLLQKYSHYDLYKRMPKIYMPMLWFEQRVHVTPDIDGQVTEMYLADQGAVFLACPAIFFLSCTLTVLVIRHFQRKCRTPSDAEPLIADVEEEHNS